MVVFGAQLDKLGVHLFGQFLALLFRHDSFVGQIFFVANQNDGGAAQVKETKGREREREREESCLIEIIRNA